MRSSLEHSALLLVDLQNDFCRGGALSVPGGDEVMAIANQLQEKFSLVVASQDWHPEDHMSFAANHQDASIGDVRELNGMKQTLWPVHCVQGSHGANFHPALATQKISHITYKGMDPAIDSYSAFFDNAHGHATDLHDYLQSKNIKHLYVMGLATDYCVLFTVLDAISLGYEVTVIEEGCRGVGLHADDIPNAIEKMKAAGSRFVSCLSNA